VLACCRRVLDGNIKMHLHLLIAQPSSLRQKSASAPASDESSTTPDSASLRP
jgi:hypothetical protein